MFMLPILVLIPFIQDLKIKQKRYMLCFKMVNEETKTTLILLMHAACFGTFCFDSNNKSKGRCVLR